LTRDLLPIAALLAVALIVGKVAGNKMMYWFLMLLLLGVVAVNYRKITQMMRSGPTNDVRPRTVRPGHQER